MKTKNVSPTVSRPRPLRTRLHHWFAGAITTGWVLSAVSGSAQSFPEARRAAEDYLAIRESAGIPPHLSLTESLRFQTAFLARLQPALGPRVGYKVGLVSREAQERFGATAPIRGALLEQMLIPPGLPVPPHFAVRPLFEADLVVVVKDKEINKATSLFDVAENLKEIVAFIELPDQFVSTNSPLKAGRLQAANVGARLGVLGQRMAMEPTQRFIEALATMTVTITDQDGQELGRGQGKAILDQPLNAVLWLIEDLQRSGERLKPGDLISLGTIKTIPYPQGKAVTVRYAGLPRGPFQVTAFLP